VSTFPINLRGLLRPFGEKHRRVTFTELFFDLVYVFAVIQLSHLLLEHLTWRGAVQTAMLFSVVWWSWVNTAWFANWFDPDKRPVRLLMFGLMLSSLIMAAMLPEAFGDRALACALAYAAMEFGRSFFAFLALSEEPVLRRNFQRILVWHSSVAVTAVAGGLAEGGVRDGIWIVSVALATAGPMMRFYVPGLGRSSVEDWDSIHGGHLAERCQLFLIIALGESILIMGTTFAGLDITFWIFVAFVAAFVGSVALWWIYFDRSADLAAERIEQSPNPGRMARSAYTYLHAIMVAGIIVTAVGDELSIAHPTGEAHIEEVLVLAGGPALFLLGHLLFKYVVWSTVSPHRVAAIAALGVLVAVGTLLPPVAVALVATGIALGVVAIDGGFLGLVRHPELERQPVPEFE
jgi:low temperature requirement protein LtrA